MISEDRRLREGGDSRTKTSMWRFRRKTNDKVYGTREIVDRGHVGFYGSYDL